MTLEEKLKELEILLRDNNFDPYSPPVNLIKSSLTSFHKQILEADIKTMEGIGVCKKCRDLLQLELCHTKTQKKEESNGEGGREITETTQ